MQGTYRSRAHARTSVEFPVQYRLPWMFKRTTVYSRDICAGGLTFDVPSQGKYLDKLWFVGLPVEIHVESAIVTFSVKARIRRVTGVEGALNIVLAFEDLPLEGRNALNRYIFFCCNRTPKQPLKRAS